MLNLTPWKRMLRRFEKPVMILLGAAGLTAILMNLDFNLLEANLYDLRVAKGWHPRAADDIVLVTLDDNTTKALDEFAPLPLDLHTSFMESLEKLEPRAVGYLVDLNQVHQVNPDLFHSDWASRFVQSVSRMQAKGTTVLLGTPYDVTGEVVPPYPLSALPHSIAVIHKDGNVFAEDKITRRALNLLNGTPAFHLDLASRMGSVPAGSLPRGSYAVPEIDASYFFFRYHGDTTWHPKRPDSLPYQRISFIDVLRGQVPAGYLQGKIALVGTLSKDDSGDFAFTPYSKTSFQSPKLVVHANILDSVIHDDGIVRAPAWVNWAMTFAVTAFVLWWVLNSTPLTGVFATLSLVFGYIAANQLLFQFRGYWLRESQPLVGIFVGYYLVVPYRLIREYKKRWDYQRKNELLTQVEEMKTNFLSLVTHDLKTPVARIQGLAEVLLRKSSERLIDRDKETLHHIMDATQELNHFITSILELSKVESKRLHIRLESKDINQLIERSVEGFKAQARARKIKLNVQLDPLFPVRIDAGLISKVINNLIDNALKYSPEGSEIHVESREVNSWIEISVRDQGIGMTEEERRNLFTRFYRAKNDTTTRITGTGLGLYLTKYFIAAHQGHVQVESEKDRGSTFKIYLPLEGASPADLKRGEETVRPGLAQRMLGLRGEKASEQEESEAVLEQ